MSAATEVLDWNDDEAVVRAAVPDVRKVKPHFAMFSELRFGKAELLAIIHGSDEQAYAEARRHPTVALWEKANRPAEVPAPQSATEEAERPLCDTTMTPRNPANFCRCVTRTDLMGPCDSWEVGDNGRCVYCDHEVRCHGANNPHIVSRIFPKPSPVGKESAAEPQEHVAFLKDGGASCRCGWPVDGLPRRWHQVEEHIQQATCEHDMHTTTTVLTLCHKCGLDASKPLPAQSPNRRELWPDLDDKLPCGCALFNLLVRENNVACGKCGDHYQHPKDGINSLPSSLGEEAERRTVDEEMTDFNEWHSRKPIHSADPREVSMAAQYRAQGWQARASHGRESK